jgi:hypothetical protein
MNLRIEFGDCEKTTKNQVQYWSEDDGLPYLLVIMDSTITTTIAITTHFAISINVSVSIFDIVIDMINYTTI